MGFKVRQLLRFLQKINTKKNEESCHSPTPAFGRLDHVLPSQRLSHHLSQRGTWVTGIPCMRLPCPSRPGRTPATAGSTDPSHKGSTTSASTSPPPTQTLKSLGPLLAHGCSQLTQ